MASRSLICLAMAQGSFVAKEGLHRGPRLGLRLLVISCGDELSHFLSEHSWHDQADGTVFLEACVRPCTTEASSKRAAVQVAARRMR